MTLYSKFQTAFTINDKANVVRTERDLLTYRLLKGEDHFIPRFCQLVYFLSDPFETRQCFLKQSEHAFLGHNVEKCKQVFIGQIQVGPTPFPPVCFCPDSTLY